MSKNLRRQALLDEMRSILRTRLRLYRKYAKGVDRQAERAFLLEWVRLCKAQRDLIARKEVADGRAKDDGLGNN